jgi:hypothetical protein
VGVNSGSTIKTLVSASFALCVILGTTSAQLPSQPTVNSVKRENGAVRDGFILLNGRLMVTRNGKTQKVVHEFVLTNGASVLPTGEIVLYTGARRHLRPNQRLTRDGIIENIVVTAHGLATAYPLAVDEDDVGVSFRDGITVSGAGALITRNGVTEKITRQMGLSNGVLVNPDGTFTKDGRKWTMRENQILGFDGVLRDARIYVTGPTVSFTENAEKSSR